MRGWPLCLTTIMCGASIHKRCYVRARVAHSTRARTKYMRQGIRSRKVWIKESPLKRSTRRDGGKLDI